MIRNLTRRMFFDTPMWHKDKFIYTLKPCAHDGPVKVFTVENRWGTLVITNSYQRAS